MQSLDSFHLSGIVYKNKTKKQNNKAWGTLITVLLYAVQMA